MNTSTTSKVQNTYIYMYVGACVFALVLWGAGTVSSAQAFTLSGVLYTDTGSVPAESGVEVAVKVGTSSLATTTTGVGGTWSFPTLSGATSTTSMLVYVNGSSTFLGNTYVTGLGGGSSATNIPIHRDTLIVTSTSTNGAIPLSGLSFYDATSDGDVLYTVTISTSTVLGHFTVATGTVQAPQNLVLNGNYTNQGTFMAGGGIVTFAATSTQIATGTLSGTSAFNEVNVSTRGLLNDGVTWEARSAAGININIESVIYANGLFVAVGGSGGTDLVVTSPDGIAWTARSAAGNDDSWQDVTYGNGLFVAVGASGDRVMTSADGITWATTTAAGDNDIWQGVTYGNGLFVAVGSSGTDRVMTSSDGITWTARSVADNDDVWADITYDNSLFVAVGNSLGTGDSVMTSSDGTTWATTTAAGDNDSWGGVTYGNGLFVAVGASGDRVMTSADGTTWATTTAAGNDDIWYSVTYGNSLFVAVGFGGTDYVMTSSDGITWTGQSPTNSTAWRGLAYGNGLFVAGGITTSLIMTSPNGTSWSTLVYEDNWHDITYGNGLFVAVGYAGDRVMTSSDGITWATTTAAGDNDNWYGVTYGNGLFVAVGNGTDRVMTSADGTTWATTTAAGNDDGWQAITYANGLFVAVGNSGDRVMTSSDGITWATTTAAGNNDSWEGIAYGNGLFVAVADLGDRVMTSSDGITWATTTAAGNNDSWQGIAYGNGLFVAVGDSGTERVMTSPDGTTWTVRSVLSDDDGWKGITYGDGLFVAVGSGNDSVMTSSNGITWTAQSSANPTYDSITSVVYYGDIFVTVGTGGSKVTTSNSGTFLNGALTLAQPASTSHLTIASSSMLTATSTLTIAGNYTNSGTFVPRATTTFASTSAQSLSGTLGGESSLGNVVMSGSGTKTFASNASTTNFTILNGATVVAPPHLTFVGNYTNQGTFVAGGGAVTFAATNTQMATGTLTGASAFNNVNVNTRQLLNDGTTWATTTAADNNDNWRGVAYGSGLFVAVGDSGDRVMTSTDGITWATTTAAGNNDGWQGITYGNGLFVAVGYSGDRVMTSSDGITWTVRSAAGNDDYWLRVTYANSLFVAVGSSTPGVRDPVMTSPDGVIWTARTALGDNDRWWGITYGNGLFVAVGSSGDRVMTSPDGITWTARSAAGDNDSWLNLIYANGLFVAVSFGTDRVMTSPDGITWATTTAAGDTGLWYGVTYGNDLFVAVGSSTATTKGEVMVNRGTFLQGTLSLYAPASTTDLTIASSSALTASSSLTVRGNYHSAGSLSVSASATTTFASTSPQSLSGILFGSSTVGNTTFAGSGAKTLNGHTQVRNMVIESGASLVAPTELVVTGNYTNNGTFTNSTLGTTTFMGSASHTATGTLVGASGLGNMEVGTGWRTRSAAGNDDSWEGITYGNGLFVAVGSSGTDRVMTSTDGITWTTRSAAGNNDSWQAVTYGNGLFVAVGSSGTDRVMTSTDGITWTARSAAGNNDQWKSITYGNGLFVAVADLGDSVMTSPDGITWTVRSAAGNNDWWQAITYGNGLFVAVGYSGDRVMTSSDGITWTVRNAANDDDHWYGVTYGNGLFVAVSLFGDTRVVTSSDGTTWTPGSALGNDDGWQAVTYGNGLFVAVGYSGDLVMTSPDGITWTARSAAGDNDQWYGITSANGLFVAVGYSGDRAMTALTPFFATTTLTFASNASTTHMSMYASSTVNAPTRLSISGNYTNDGVFNANFGTTTFAGTASQIATGTLSATSSFYNLEVLNTQGTTTFATTTTVTNVFSAVASTTVAFPAGATTTIATLNLRGSATNKMFLRSTQNGVAAQLNVTTSLDNNYLDVKDSDATPGIDLNAYQSIDSGNTTAWTFVVSPTFSSASNQEFTVGQATTPIATITVTDTVTPSITSVNDLRIIIATSTHNMRWDTTDTTATFGGTASGKVSGTVSYEGGGSVLVIDVTSNFSASDTLTISGLSFTEFTVYAAPAVALSLSHDGDAVGDVNDTATIAITVLGALTVSDHDLGQVANAFTFQNQTAVPIYRFKMVPTGESVNIATTTFALSGVRRIDNENLTNISLYRDYNANGVVDGSDVAVGGAGVLAVSEQDGSITFGTTYQATTSQNYIVISDITAVKPNEYMTMTLNVSGTVTGVTTGALITPTGFVSSVQHIRGGGGSGSTGGTGAIGGDAPPGQATTTGGEQGGGEEIGSTPGFQAPGTSGAVHNEWTTGASGITSDEVYATAAATNVRQSYSVFGFNVPGGNTVTGIEVKLEASGSTAAGTIEVALSWNGESSITSTKTTSVLTGSDVVYTLGSPSDLWGRTWTPAELGDANFFVRVIGQPDSNTVRVDAIQVKPYHAAGGGGGGGGGEI